jgi:dipeptidase D
MNLLCEKSVLKIVVLLDVLSFHTRIVDAKAITIGGDSNSRIFTHVVSFGPSMPATQYTRYSE